MGPPVEKTSLKPLPHDPGAKNPSQVLMPRPLPGGDLFCQEAVSSQAPVPAKDGWARRQVQTLRHVGTRCGNASATWPVLRPMRPIRSAAGIGIACFSRERASCGPDPYRVFSVFSVHQKKGGSPCKLPPYQQVAAARRCLALPSLAPVVYAETGHLSGGVRMYPGNPVIWPQNSSTLQELTRSCTETLCHPR